MRTLAKTPAAKAKTAARAPPAAVRGPAVQAHAPVAYKGCACGGSCPRCKGNAIPALSTAAPGSDSLPGSARAGIASPGTPLDPALGRSLGSRLGADFSGVRVHADAAAADAAHAMGARAYTYGSDVAFGRRAWAPNTGAGLGLLAHELTHVAQQMRGDTSSLRHQEQAADAAERGRMGSSPAVPARTAWPSTTRRPVAAPALRLRAGDVLRMTIRADESGAAQYELEIEEGAAVTGSGTATGLPAGEYRVRLGGADLMHMPITRADGSPLPTSTGFTVTIPPAVARRLREAHGTIPLSVSPLTAPPSTAPAGGSDGTGAAPASPQQALDALPPRLRAFLFSANGPHTRAEDIPTLLRIARAIADLSDEELAEYRDRSVRPTTYVDGFERGVMAWLAEVRARRAATVEEQTASSRLYGLKPLYELYAQWQWGSNAGGGFVPTAISPPADELARYEATPFASLHVRSGGSTWQLYYQLRQGLDAAGFANVEAFGTAVSRFLAAFRERAFYVALESLGRYEHLLTEQQRHYADPDTLDALNGRLATAHRQVEATDRFARTIISSVMDHGDRSGTVAQMRAEHSRMRGEALQSATAATPAATDPLASERSFDRLDLARQDRASLGPFLQDYIGERLGNVRRTRETLVGDHEKVFSFDQLVRATRQLADIDDDTVWARAIADHSAPSMDAAIFGVATGVLLIALTIATAGTGLPALAVAAGSLGMSGYFAVEAYEDYATAHDAYGANLLSHDPWIGWVVIAVIGAGLDLAAVGGALRALRPAATALQLSGDLPAFNAAVGELIHDPRVRQAVLEAAAARTEAQAAWRAVAESPTVAPRGAMRGSLFGLDVVIDTALALPRTLYATWLEARAGVRSFQRWILTPEAVALYGDVNQFSRAHLREVQAIYAQASAAMERVASHARGIGMSASEVDAVLRWWARWQRGSADDLIRLIDQQRALGIDAATLGRMSAEVDATGVRLAASAIEDPLLRAELLRDERVWRMLHNADYDPAALTRAWLDFRRVRPPSERLASTSFGEFLINSSAYRATLGRTPPRPLIAVITNWATLVGAERTQAVFRAAEPRLAAALAGSAPIPGVNPQTLAELRSLLQSDLVGPTVTMYDGARSTVMGLANEIIGRTTRTEPELRAILALTDSSGSVGSIGERFAAGALSHPAFAASDLGHVSFSAAEIPGLHGGAGAFIPDRIIGAAHLSLDVKTGYAGGIDIADQAHNYELLRALSQASPTGPVALRAGGPLQGHIWMVLPGADAAITPAQTVARRMWSQLMAEDLLASQRVFYLDSTGAIMQVTGPASQVRAGAGATIHEALGLLPPPAAAAH